MTVSEANQQSCSRQYGRDRRDAESLSLLQLKDTLQHKSKPDIKRVSLQVLTSTKYGPPIISQQAEGKKQSPSALQINSGAEAITELLRVILGISVGARNSIQHFKCFCSPLPH